MISDKYQFNYKDLQIMLSLSVAINKYVIFNNEEPIISYIM